MGRTIQQDKSRDSTGRNRLTNRTDLWSRLMKRFLLLAATLLVTCNAASAQSGQPYAGLEQRPIKALSQQQADDLRTGRGMGLALAAELNGYPGPSHVLELGNR